MALRELQVRNTYGGAIWQVYHVANQTEVDMLTRTARCNGFQSFETVHKLENKETWPGWRETEGWKLYAAGKTMAPDFA